MSISEILKLEIEELQKQEKALVEFDQTIQEFGEKMDVTFDRIDNLFSANRSLIRELRKVLTQ